MCQLGSKGGGDDGSCFTSLYGNQEGNNECLLK